MKKRVKIIQMVWGQRWYHELIGVEIEVIEISGYEPSIYIACDNGFPVLKIDCEVV